MDLPLVVHAALVGMMLWSVYHLLKTLNRGSTTRSRLWMVSLDGAILGGFGGILVGAGIGQSLAWAAGGAVTFYVLASLALDIEKEADSDLQTPPE